MYPPFKKTNYYIFLKTNNMKFTEIEFKSVKTYKVSRDVKLSLLKGVIVRDGETPAIPAENAVASEEVLILWMTNLTQKTLEELSEEDYIKVLTKINEVETVPNEASSEK